MASECHFRLLRRAIQRACPVDNFLCDGRDKLISYKHRPIVPLLEDRAKGGFKILWHRDGASDLFSSVAQVDIAKDYHTAAAAEPAGG